MRLAGEWVLLAIGICNCVFKKITSYLYKILAQVLHLPGRYFLWLVLAIFIWSFSELQLSWESIGQQHAGYLIINFYLCQPNAKTRLDITGDAYMKR